MKKISVLILVVSLAWTHSFAATVSDSLPFFNRIELSSSGRLTLQQGAKAGVITKSAVHLSSKEVQVKNGTLVIDGSVGGDWSVTLPELKGLEVSGYGSISADSTFMGEQLEILISGNGKVTLPVKYTQINTSITGYGKVTLVGSADSVIFKISGSGKIDASGLVVSKCKAAISGVGKCTVDVRDELISDISGSGKIDYLKEPTLVETKITGIGKVNGSEAVVIKLPSDTTSISLGDVDLLVVDRKELRSISKDRITPTFPLLELGLNPYCEKLTPIGRSAPQLMTEKSVSVALNVFQQSWELGNSNIWLTTRVGFTWNNYRWQGGNVQVVKGDSAVSFNYLIDNRVYRKSKLTACYVTAPLLFNFMTSRDPKKNWTFGVGAMLGMRLGSHSKMVYNDMGQDVKEKTRSDYYLNPFRYGARCSIGYRHFSIFADYYLSELFKPGAGPELTPLNFGITLIGFRL